jgi:hypothetical protein
MGEAPPPGRLKRGGNCSSGRCEAEGYPAGKSNRRHMGRDAAGHGDLEQERIGEAEAKNADGNAQRDQKCQMVGSDDGMAESGQNTLGKRRRRPAPHHMMRAPRKSTEELD